MKICFREKLFFCKQKFSNGTQAHLRLLETASVVWPLSWVGVVGGVEGVSGFQGVVSVGGTQGVESVGPEGEGEGGLGLCGVVSVPGSVGGLVGSKVVCGTGT